MFPSDESCALTLLGQVSIHEQLNLNTSLDINDNYEDIHADGDLAITHQRNAELRQQESVKVFFNRVEKINEVWNKEDREWLAMLPHEMCADAIPLFESSIDGKSEDYQLHPSYSWLTQGVNVEDPDIIFRDLSDTELLKRHHSLFIPLGRLFVNVASAPGNRARLTKWTGYELFVADDLGLWVVFDGHSLVSPAPMWYPVSCSLTKDFEGGIACLLSSLRELKNAKFQDIKLLMRDTYQTGSIVINEVEKSDAQDKAHAASEGRLMANSGSTPLTLAIKEESEEWVKRLLEIGANVNHANVHGDMPIALAVGTSNAAIVELLLNTDEVKVDIKVKEHQTLLEYAAQIAYDEASLSVLEKLRNFAEQQTLKFIAYKSTKLDARRSGGFRNTPIISIRLC